MNKKQKKTNPTTCKVCGTPARRGGEYCSRHARMGAWGIGWLIRLRRRDSVLFGVVVVGVPLLLAAVIVVLAFWWRSFSPDPEAVAVEAMRDRPELFSQPFQEALEQFGVIVPSSDPIGVIKTPQETVDELRRAYPDVEEAAIGMIDEAQAAMAAADYPRAEELYRALIKRFPEVGDLHLRLAQALILRQEYQAAAEQFKTYLELTPDDAIAHNDLGWVLTQLGDDSSAVVEFETTIRLDSTKLVSYMNLSKALTNLDRHEEALGALEPLVALGNRLPGSFMSIVAMSLGAGYLDQDSARTAAVYFDRAGRLDTTNALAYHNLGIALGRANDLPRCIQAFARAVRLSPGMPHWRYLLARAYQANGQIDQAMLEMHKALEMDPEYFSQRFGPGDGR